MCLISGKIQLQLLTDWRTLYVTAQSCDIHDSLHLLISHRSRTNKIWNVCWIDIWNFFWLIPTFSTLRDFSLQFNACRYFDSRNDCIRRRKLLQTAIWILQEHEQPFFCLYRLFRDECLRLVGISGVQEHGSAISRSGKRYVAGNAGGTFPLQRRPLLDGSGRKDATRICMTRRSWNGLPDLEFEIYSSEHPFQRLLILPCLFPVLFASNRSIGESWIANIKYRDHIQYYAILYALLNSV